MKLLCICVVALATLSPVAFAQTSEVHAKPLTDDDIKLLRQDVQSVKDDVIKHTMQFSPAEAEKFWPLYRQYASEQAKIADKRLGVLTDYAKNLDQMDDAKATSLTERYLQIQDDNLALDKKYFPKFAAALGARRAAKFYQVDNRLTMMVDIQLASEVPLIP